ncbi:hypothetical protein BH23BAC4_BH23BAC4_06220 [soil metagenome]
MAELFEGTLQEPYPTDGRNPFVGSLNPRYPSHLINVGSFDIVNQRWMQVRSLATEAGLNAQVYFWFGSALLIYPDPPLNIQG